MSNLVGIILSIALHLSLVVLAISSRDVEEETQSGGEVSRTVVEREGGGEIEVHLLTEAEADAKSIGTYPGIDGAPDARICAGKDHTYVGIGIMHQPLGMEIISAPASYPAYKAGARVGDVIVELYRIPSSRFMVLHVDRAGKHFTWKIGMESICFEQKD